MKTTKTKPKIDKYASRFVAALKAVHTDEELACIVNKIYENGFEDGHEEGVNDERENPGEF